MKKVFLPFLFLLLLLSAAGQKNLPTAGQVTYEELKMKSCSFDPDAPAMKFFEEEEVSFELYTNGDMQLKTEHRTRIKIFNENGYEHANIDIPYLTKKSLGKIKELTAYVYSLDQNDKIVVQKLGKDDFFKQTVVGKLGLIKFSFPNLKRGSVIEYSYTRMEQNFFDIDPWEVQDDIPTAYTSLVVITPKTSILRNKVYGQDSLKILPLRKKNTQLNYASWYMENVPAFKVEPYMTSRIDNRIRMVFFHFPISNSMISTITNPVFVWSMVGEHMLEDAEFGGQIKKQIRGTDKIIDSAKALSSVGEKIKFVYAAVKRRFPGDKDISREIKDLNDAWKDQTGTTGEINLILLNLLGKLKVKSYPLLVSTRSNGMVDKYFPSFGQLNSVVAVAMIDSSHYYLLDASLSHQSIDCPPVNILNREALLLRAGNIQWFMIEDQRPLFKQIANIMCDITKEGILEGGASLQHYNYAKQYVLDTADETDKRNENFLSKKTPGLKIVSSEKTLTESEEDPLYETINFTYEPEQTNEFYFFKPSFLFQIPGNPFVSEKRSTDIDFGYNQEIITSLQISFQPSFEKDHLPGSIKLISPDSSLIFTRMVSYKPGQIDITTNLQVKKPLYPKEEYASIRDFFKRLQGLAAEEIILKKKN